MRIGRFLGFGNNIVSITAIALLLIWLTSKFVSFNSNNKNKQVSDIEIVFLASKSENQFAPPFADLFYYMDGELNRLTNDEFYNTNPSINKSKNVVYFESKRGNKALGMSQMSGIYEIDLSTKRIGNITDRLDFVLNQEYLVDGINVLDSTGDLIGLNATKSGERYFFIVNLSEQEIKFAQKLNNSDLYEIVIGSTFLTIHNLDVPMGDQAKNQIINLNNMQLIGFDGEDILVPIPSLRGNYFKQVKNAISQLVKWDDSQLIPIKSYNNLETDAELVYIIDDYKALLLQYLEGENALYYLNKNNLEEVYRAPLILEQLSVIELDN